MNWDDREKQLRTEARWVLAGVIIMFIVIAFLGLQVLKCLQL